MMNYANVEASSLYISKQEGCSSMQIGARTSTNERVPYPTQAHHSPFVIPNVREKTTYFIEYTSIKI
jgi:hypothetical protein